LQEPLRKIQAFGDRLNTKYSDLLKGDGQDYLQRMKNAASRMQILINDLLNFSRVKKTNQKFENIALNSLVKEVLDDLEPRIVQTHARIEVSDLPVIPGDKRQLGQLFQNLIGNAIKFQKKDVQPLIKITSVILSNSEIIKYNLALNKSYFKIAVKDNGIGFDNKYLDKIFTIFQRLHGRHEYEGTGIGLAICRKVVESHNGLITAESQPDVGTTFYVILPEKHSN
jgi:light-regulated signal transduction histidine kinase (bacteriophytochrome)